MNAKQTDVLEVEAMGHSALDDLLAADTGSRRDPAPQCQPQIGTLAGFTDSGFPMVTIPGRPELLVAKHTCALGAADAGREVVLAFENGEPGKPIVMGVLQPPVLSHTEAHAQPASASLDGEQIMLSAKNEIVLRCGKASITLTRAGKIIIRGAYVLSRSSGVNRIKGGSVQIN
jgi:hypothetical protein